MKFNVVFITDHSASMSGVRDAAKADLISLVDNLVATETQDIETRVAHVKIADGIRGENSSSQAIPLHHFATEIARNVYKTNGGCTPLWDAVHSGISLVSNVASPEDVNLVMVITDGQDNASSYSYSNLNNEIQKLQLTDRWTFLFRVPNGYASYIRNRLSAVPSDNIQEWETTSAGLNRATVANTVALTNFRGAVASGQSTSSSRFYANLDNVSSDQVKAVMKDISSEVMIFAVAGQAGSQIRTFVNDRLAPFNQTYKTGAAFYQLTKPERAVQSYKIIVVRDKTSKAIYGGHAARDLLGVPRTGNIALSPGRHGNYEIFVQSTSINRKLDQNTDLIYWPGFDGSVQPVLAKPAPVVSTAPIQLASVNNVINNVRAVASKAKPAPVVNSVIANAREVTSAKTLIKKVAAKKTTRVRNRDTIESRIRKAVHQASDGKTSLKKTLNTTKLQSIGIYQVDALKIATQLLSRFNASYKSYSVFFNEVAQLVTVGDMIALIKKYGGKI